MNKIVNENKLRAFCQKHLVGNGMSETDAASMTEILVTTDKWGIYSHGTKNLFGYVQKVKAGGVSFSDQPKVIADFPSLTVIDACNTMGYISSSMAMNDACRKAKENGIAIAFVKNSSHNGAAGYYANIAASQGMLGISVSNVDKKMTIPGAKGMVMGHNPFALAAPAEPFPSIILDVATSNVASLRVLKAKAAGEKIPDTWISDKDGKPTTDPSRYPDEGALLPFANHKGYGIAVFIEILTSIMLGKETSTNSAVRSWCFDLDQPNNVCHAFVAINPQLVSDKDAFIGRVGDFVRELTSAPKADGVERIFVPGENLWENLNKAEKEGFVLPQDVLDELNKLAEASHEKLDIFEGE